MNDSQLRKFKGSLVNINSQIQSACLKLTNDPDEQQTMHRLRLAAHQIDEALKQAENIKAREVEQRKPKKKKVYPTPEIVVVRDPLPRTFNMRCRNYTEVRDKTGNTIERGCIVGMDMDFCSKNCAYATNNVCTLKG